MRRLANWKYMEVRDFLRLLSPGIREAMLDTPDGRSGVFEHIVGELISDPNIDWAERAPSPPFHCYLDIPSSESATGHAEAYVPGDRMTAYCYEVVKWTNEVKLFTRRPAIPPGGQH